MVVETSLFHSKYRPHGPNLESSVYNHVRHDCDSESSQMDRASNHGRWCPDPSGLQTSQFRSANRLVIRFVAAKVKAATQRLRNRIRRMGASRIARNKMMPVVITIDAAYLYCSFRALLFGLLQDGDVGVGVFPEVRKSFVCGECPR